VKQVLPSLGADVQMVSIDVVQQESAELLRRYAIRNGFDWRLAMASNEMDQALVNRFGSGFLTTTSVPMFIIDRNGQVHLTRTGRKSAKDLQDLVIAKSG